MSLGKPLDLTQQYKQNIYSITLDMSGWDKTTFQVLAPVAGTFFVYGSNNSGAVQGVTQGNAELATNFSTIQATKLSDGTAVTSVNAAGLYKVDVNAQFLRLQGGGANVYGLLFFHSKIG